MNELIMLHSAIALLCLLLGLHFLLSPQGRPWPLRLTGATYLLYGSQSLLLVLSLQHMQLFPAQTILRPVGAMLLAPLFWCFFQVLQRPDARLHQRDLWHLIPAVLTFYLLLSGSILLDYLDLFLLLSYAGYLLAVLVTVSRDPARLASLGDAAPVARRYLQLQGTLLGTNLLVEAMLYLELQQGGTVPTSGLLLPAAALFLLLHLLTLLFALQRSPLLEWLYQRSQQKPQMQRQETPSLSEPLPVDALAPLPVDAQTPLADEAQIPLPDGSAAADEKLQVVYQRWLELLEQQQLYQLEFGITLAQAARKLQVPARQLSQAVNQCYGASFSVLLNDKRISKAKQLLLQNPPLAVTEVMYQAGFATKSNFHKEFVRVTGMAPGAYRASAAMQSD
ncbi:helix-turn-helix domain-containing protein [Rheinheimera sp. F8]|uniref:helix-turn-helix domain-containing protein n=1 Tax=Rheinheimera sp. F8 TaxID=1763998 RepID=UPI001AD7F851|nr:helix-turn-helix domain-containing protein [Rheinheimera sp. F8]